MSTRTVVAVNTASQIMGKILSAGAALLVSFVVARNLGAEGYGEFTKIITYVAFFFLIADFGLNAIYLQQNFSFPTLLFVRVVGSLFLIFLSLAILSFLPQGVDQGYTGFVRLGIILFSPAIFFQGLITSANAIFQKEMRYDRATIAIALGCVVTLLFLFIINSALVGVFALLLGSVVTAISALILIKKFVPPLSFRFDIKEASRLVLLTTPLGLTLVFNLVYFHVDSVILTLTRATTEVGVYGFAYKIFEGFLVLPTFFMNAVYPIMLKSIDREFLKLFKKLFFFLLLSSFVLIVTLWVAAPLLSLVNQDFSQSIRALQILSLGLPFFFVSALVMWALIAYKKQSQLVVIYGVGMVVNIVLNLWFVPRFGYIAAAWITVFSEAFVLFVSGLVLRKLLWA